MNLVLSSKFVVTVANGNQFQIRESKDGGGKAHPENRKAEPQMYIRGRDHGPSQLPPRRRSETFPSRSDRSWPVPLSGWTTSAIITLRKLEKQLLTMATFRAIPARAHVRRACRASRNSIKSCPLALPTPGWAGLVRAWRLCMTRPWWNEWAGLSTVGIWDRQTVVPRVEDCVGRVGCVAD